MERLSTSCSSLVRRMSSVFPLMWVGHVISLERFFSNTKSQKRLETNEVPQREAQHMSGWLKSPMIIRDVSLVDRKFRKAINRSKIGRQDFGLCKQHKCRLYDVEDRVVQ